MKKPRNKLNSKTQNGSAKAETCFVAMPFRPPFYQYYQDIFEPAVRRLGWTAVRADSLSRPSSIIDDIERLIRSAKVVIADLSEQNSNVLFEIGLARGLQKPVILLAEKIKDVPSDLRERRVILYDKNNSKWGIDLKRRIEQALRETVSNIKSTVPTVFMGSPILTSGNRPKAV